MIVGIIGGGQLGMYLAIEAYSMGYETIVYDENKECSAAKIATKFICDSFDSYESLEDFAKQCDVITYEFENINSDIIESLASKYNIIQKATPLKIASSRFQERKMAQDLKIIQPKWQYINKKSDLNLEYPYILKIDSLGYDGKGQYHIENEADLKNVNFDGKYYLAEQKIDFDYEISIIAIRSTTDEIVCYEPFYNIHYKGILNITKVDAKIPLIVSQKAIEIAKEILMKNNIYGILCCEFLVKDNTIYFNELAPRPHNSGHITMDTHYCSQYENHLRAIVGLPLGSTKRKASGFMINVLGQDDKRVVELLVKYPKELKYYDYHKNAKYNRKIGHLVCFNNDLVDFFENKWR